ncbi:MAG: WG repeat-containing protein [Acetivibrionales bacterium]|jgi:hypothetical protein
MLRKLKLYVIIAIICALAIPLNACQRLRGKTEDVDLGEEGNIEENINNKEGKGEKNKPDEPQKSGEKDTSPIPFAKNNGFDVTYGYKDKSGNIVIEPKFRIAEPFFESGVAPVVDINGKTGLIDKQGNYLAEADWEYLSFNDGVFLGYHSESNISSVFDANGKLLFQKGAYIGQFSEGLAEVYGEGYIDKTGSIALNLNYEFLRPFCNGIAEVAKDFLSPSYYIDKQGNDMTEKVSSGLKVYRDENTGLFGYKDMQGKVVIYAQYYEANPFLNGYAVVNAADDIFNGRYGIIDTKGNLVLEPKYCGIIRMRNGLIAVGEELGPDEYNNYGYFDFCKKSLYTADLKKSTGWKYNLVEDLDGEYVCVNDDDSVYFLDSKLEQSRELPKLPGRSFSVIRDGKVLRGYFNNIITVVDLKGNILAKVGGGIDLGDGIISEDRTVLSKPVTQVNYPVLSGMKDLSIQNKINENIYKDMVTSYEDFARFNGSDDSSYLGSTYVISREKDLILIDQRLNAYYFGAAHGYYFRNTLYIDAATGKVYTLGDLFKADSGIWDYLSNAVSAKMNENMADIGYFEDSVRITADNTFALSKDSLIIYFTEGDIAAYAAGMLEFDFPYSELSDYIDKQGEFWNSFN